MTYINKIKFVFAKALKIILNPPALRECKIHPTSRVCSRSELSNVVIGRYSYVGNMCFLVNTDIGSFCSIADRCCIGGACHPLDRVSTSPVFHNGRNIMGKNFANLNNIETPLTVIENDVWIGMGVYVKAGVRIGNGAVIGMGSVVTHDVPPYEIWAGNPAKKIRGRVEQKYVKDLMKSNWWEWDEGKLSKVGNKFGNIKDFLDEIN